MKNRDLVPSFIMSRNLLTSLVMAAGLCSCLGGDSSGTVSGLSMPGSMDLVTASGVASGGALTAPSIQSNFPPGSDFSTDFARAHVWDQSTEPLDMINDILVQLSQTCADKLVNQGPYLALIEVQERDGDSSPSSGNASSATNAVEYESWIVNSTRSSNTSPQSVRFWIEGEEEVDQNVSIDSTIHAKSEVTAEPDAQNPFGRFSLDYAMTVDGTDTMFQRGTLSAGPSGNGMAGFSFLGDTVNPNDGGDTQIAVETNAARTSGRARVRATDWNTGLPIQFLIAFDGNQFARKIAGQVQVFDRDRFRINTWGYNLYWAANGNGHSAGDRVQLESGFPFTFNYQGARSFGHVGYWGIWSSVSGLPANGAIVTRDQAGTPEQYTVVRAPGKLIHVEKVELPLADLDNATFEWWDWNSGSQFMIVYEHDAQSGIGTFSKIAEWNQLDSNWDDIDPAEALTINPGDWFGFWSRTLGGSISYLGGATSVTIQKQSYASADDTLFNGANSITLYGLTQCLKSAMTASQVEIGDIWLADAAPETPWEFTFSETTRGLTRNGARVGLMAGEVPTSGPFLGGMRSGPLSTTSPEQLGITEAWQMWNLDEFYFWETGHNDWNQFATVRNSTNDFVQFDAPLGFLYEHEQVNDANDSADFAGQTFWLEYGGPGQFWGIPQGEVDVDGDLVTDRWYPQFSLRDGTVVGANGEYVVRAIESELSMLPTIHPVPPSLLQALTAAAQLVLPTLAGWTNPVDHNIPTNLGAPKVVGGVLVN